MLGIDRHIEDKGYGERFKRLQEVLGQRDSNKRDICVEPGIPSCGNPEAVTPPTSVTPPPRKKGNISIKNKENYMFIA